MRFLERYVVVHEGYEGVHDDVSLSGLGDLLLTGYDLARDTEFLASIFVEFDDEIWVFDARARERVWSYYWIVR